MTRDFLIVSNVALWAIFLLGIPFLNATAMKNVIAVHNVAIIIVVELYETE